MFQQLAAAFTLCYFAILCRADPQPVAGFSNPQRSSSIGGKASCVSGQVSVSASSNQTVHLNYALPANQAAVDKTFVEIVQANSSLVATVTGPSTTTQGNYSISAKICFPNDTPPSSTLYFLIHGIGFDKSYWEFASEYSFVDVLAEAGYVTFLYDRLGTGRSDRPDPIQELQTPLEVAVAHELIRSLRDGAIASFKPSSIVGVGHSYGSIQVLGLTVNFPTDLDAAVLTAFTTATDGEPFFFAAGNLVIASKAAPVRFPTLSNGYLVTSSEISTRFIFFRSPNYDLGIADQAEATKQTVGFGELFTLSLGAQPAIGFTGAVFAITGENDLVFCRSDCNYPTNLVAEVPSQLYPAAKITGWSIVPGAGHGLHLHYSAANASRQIIEFVQSAGL